MDHLIIEITKQSSVSITRRVPGRRYPSFVFAGPLYSIALDYTDYIHVRLGR